MNLQPIWEEIVATVVVALLAFIFGRLFRIFQLNEKARKYIIIALFISIVAFIIAGPLYVHSGLLSFVTLGLVILVLTIWYYDYTATQKKLIEQKQAVDEQQGKIDEQQKLINELKKKIETKSPLATPQAGKSYTVGTRWQNHIDVRILKRTGLASGKELDLTWETIWDGVEAIARQISRYKGACRPDLILGINELGTIVASYLNSRLWQGEKEIGIIRSGTPEGKNKMRPIVFSIPETFSGNKSHGLRILLVDSEIKSGQSIKQIVDCLNERFAVKQIYVAVLTACRVNAPVEEMEHLMYKKDNNAQEQPLPVPIDFLAFFTTGDVEPPEALR